MGDAMMPLIEGDQAEGTDSVVVGNHSTNGVNIHKVGSLQIHRTFCGQEWDSKHCILGFIVVMSISVMITTLAVVVTKCSQTVYINCSPNNDPNKFHMRLTFPPKWSDDFMKTSLTLPNPGNYTIHFELKNQTNVAAICIDLMGFPAGTENTESYTIYCSPTNISWPCPKVCEGDCDIHNFYTSHPILLQYKLDDNCLQNGGYMELTEN